MLARLHRLPSTQLLVILTAAVGFQFIYWLWPMPFILATKSPLLHWLPLVFGAVSVLSWFLANKLVGELAYTVVYVSLLGQLLLLLSLHG